MSYQLSIVDENPKSHSYNKEILCVGTTMATELLDSILSNQSYVNGAGYERTYANSDELRDRFKAIVTNKNENYFKFLAFVVSEVIRNLNENPTKLAYVGASGDVIEYWEDVSKKHTRADGTIIKKYQVDELLEYEDTLADVGNALAHMKWRVGAYDGDSLFYIISIVNILRVKYNNDSHYLDTVRYSIGWFLPVVC